MCCVLCRVVLCCIIYCYAIGLSFTVKLTTTTSKASCAGGKLCEMMFNKLGGNKELLLFGNLGLTNFEIQFQSSDELNLHKTIAIKKWFIKFSMNSDGVKVSLAGDVVLDILQKQYKFHGK